LSTQGFQGHNVSNSQLPQGRSKCESILEKKLVGGEKPPHLKNRIVKLDHETLEEVGENYQKCLSCHPENLCDVNLVKKIFPKLPD